jgi:hypothetical protein
LQNKDSNNLLHVLPWGLLSTVETKQNNTTNYHHEKSTIKITKRNGCALSQIEAVGE